MTVLSGAMTSPQPARPRRQIPETPFAGSSSLAASSATWGHVGFSGMVTPAFWKSSLL